MYMKLAKKDKRKRELEEEADAEQNESANSVDLSLNSSVGSDASPVSGGAASPSPRSARRAPALSRSAGGGD